MGKEKKQMKERKDSREVGNFVLDGPELRSLKNLVKLDGMLLRVSCTGVISCFALFLPNKLFPIKWEGDFHGRSGVLRHIARVPRGVS